MKEGLFRTSIGLAVLVFGAGTNGVSVQAATLAAVPMQGGMVMPMIAYHAGMHGLHVMLDPAVPQLTPLLVSNPGDGFSPDDPWYGALDPGRQGLAFSRRYGFVMDAMTDPLPAGTAIWLRKLAGAAEVGAYRYANTEPKAFEPIFGTAGSPTAMRWNGMMFHPTFTAPAGTATYHATFDAYLADAATGAELPGTSTGPFELTWTVVSDGRPALSIARKIVLSWPAAAGNYVLESADSVSTANWSVVPETVSNFGGSLTVLLEPAAASRVYRLRQGP